MQRVSELAGNFEIYAVCPPCGRMEALALADILARFGPAVTLADVRPRLRCHRCGMRSHDLRVVYVGPEGRAAQFRYRR